MLQKRMRKGAAMTAAIQVVTTTDTEEGAARLARMLVERRLAACVQVVGPVASVYRWQGRIEEAREWQCLIKTRADRYDAIAAAIRALHSYEVPEIIAVPIVAGDPAYLDWLGREAASPG